MKQTARLVMRRSLQAAGSLIVLCACDHGHLNEPPVGPSHISHPVPEGSMVIDAPSIPDAAPARLSFGGANSPPAMGGQASGMGAGTGAGGIIEGEIRISDDLARLASSSAAVFVMARPEGVTSGPPLATVRLKGDGFPIRFRLGPENVMIAGMSLSGRVSISARLDQDGNAMTRKPGDVAGAVPTPVEVGSGPVTIELNQPL